MALNYRSLPDGVIAKARLLIADLLLAAAAGERDATSRALVAAMPIASGSSRVWFAESRRSCSAADATFVNTLNAATLDFDSLNASVHADLVTLPAAWAMAEQLGRSPRELTLAYVIAAELVSRLARCASGAAKGWSGTSIYGGIGAALACGLLLKLDRHQLGHALGLAAAQASGTQQANIELTLAKRLQPAFAARAGVVAACLAQAGATAPSQALEGRFGLRVLYQPGDDAPLLDGWGRQWQLLDTAIKRFPVCACSHAAIQAMLDLLRQTPCAPGDVLEVVAVISPFMNRLVGGEFRPGADVQVLAQFNLRYHLACALLRGDVSLRDLAPTAVHDPAIAALIPRIRLQVDAGNLHELAPATVCLILRDGRRLTATCQAMPGSPKAPLSEARWQAKLADCVSAANPDAAQALPAVLAKVAGFCQLNVLHSIWE